MSTRARLVAFGVVCVLVVAAAVTAIVVDDGPGRRPGTASEAVTEVPVADLESEPRIVFRNTATSGYGRVAMVSLDDPGGPRAVTDQSCDRVAASAEHTACLQARTSITSSYIASVSRPGKTALVAERPGIPSRTRLSPGGTEMASTAFVAGDSYNRAGFSTRTFITSLETGGSRHLEDFTLVHRGRTITPIDRNYWGVTFVDEDAFYATVAFGGDTWLARGSIRDSSIRTMATVAECPSLSPDGTRVAFKRRQSDGGWRIAVMDLATKKETFLRGERSVDDQVAWLDDRTVLYALPRTGADSGSADVWSVAADGSAAPRILIRLASSPTVVR